MKITSSCAGDGIVSAVSCSRGVCRFEWRIDSVYTACVTEFENTRVQALFSPPRRKSVNPNGQQVRAISGIEDMVDV